MKRTLKSQHDQSNYNMASELPTDLINQIQISAREQAGLSAYDPARSSEYPAIPSLSGNVAALDPSPPYLRCKHCKGRLLRGVQSLLCIYCARLNDAAFPDPISFRDTIGYSWLLQSLHLDGSEMVEVPSEKHDTNRGQGTPKDKISLSKILNFQILWTAKEENSGNDVVLKKVEQNNNSLQWTGFELDDFFLDSKRDNRSVISEQPVISTQVHSVGAKSVATRDDLSFFQHGSPSEPAVTSTADKDHEFSGWQADFQSSGTGTQHASQSFGTSTVPATDLSTHLDSVFGSRIDSKPETPETFSTSVNWTSSDNLWNNVNSETSPQSWNCDSSVRREDNLIQTNVAYSTSGDWFQGGERNINNMKPHQTEIFNEDDNSLDDWNDFTGSSSFQNPSRNSLTEGNSQKAVSHERPSELDLFSSGNTLDDADNSSFPQADSFSSSLSKNDILIEASSTSAEVTFSDRVAEETGLAEHEDAVGHGVEDLDNMNASTNPKEDVQMLISQMHDLSFMLENDLSVPSRSDTHNFFL